MTTTTKDYQKAIKESIDVNADVTSVRATKFMRTLRLGMRKYLPLSN